jgi:SAM-dependent MidA family methyltransferase
VTFDRFMDAALYDTERGFFESGRGAGRAGGDFVTSPEIGSLFGACVARALDRLWHALGAPDPFLVVEAGAGSGRLARDVVRAAPECAPALRYVLVERSGRLRAEQRETVALEPIDEALGPFVRSRDDDRPMPEPAAGPVIAALDELPAVEADGGVVLANELLDNLVFGIAHWDGKRWHEVRVGLDGDGGFVELLVPAADDDAAELARVVEGHDLPHGLRLPIPRGMRDWFRECDGVLRRGFLLLVDYVVDLDELVARGAPGGWLRTYRAHRRGGDALTEPGAQDITAEVVREQLHHSTDFDPLAEQTQADWLRAHGIDDLVADGQRVWAERAHLGDLEAIAGRSRGVEAAALTDPSGLGAHRVMLLGRRVAVPR